MYFKFNEEKPLYLQIEEQLTDAIFTQVFVEGQQVPSTTEISQQFHLNPATVLKGMNRLVEADLLEKRRGLGMFVKQGAHQKIVQQRRENFYQEYIVSLIQEAKKLNLEIDEINELIRRGMKADE